MYRSLLGEDFVIAPLLIETAAAGTRLSGFTPPAR